MLAEFKSYDILNKALDTRWPAIYLKKCCPKLMSNKAKEDSGVDLSGIFDTLGKIVESAVDNLKRKTKVEEKRAKQDPSPPPPPTNKSGGKRK